MKNKIPNLNDLSKILDKKRKDGYKIVMCHGVFDLIHLGHLEHFREAKKNGDILVVTTTSDQFINKGPGKPYFPSLIRKKVLNNLEIIDYISEIDDESAVKGINKIRPDFYCKGVDYKKNNLDLTKNIKKEVNAVKKNNGKIIYTNEISFSSSKLLNLQENIFNQNQRKEINKIKKLYNLDEIEKIFKKIKKMNILVIGEIIIDEYISVDPLGKSGKDPIMMFRELYVEKFLGGSGYIANNISNFCKKVNLISIVGEKFEYKKFIQNKLNRNVKLQFINKANSPTILKRKYIDNLSKNKLTGFYQFNDNNLNAQENIKLIKYLKSEIKKADLVLVSDYDHGMISQSIANFISNNSKFLITNTQFNAANTGHHTINKYKNTDFLFTNEKELRHEMRDKISNIKVIVKKFMNKSKIKNLIVTQGSDGAILFSNKKNQFYKSEAYTKKVIDKIGAGDTLMSIFSIFIKASKNSELSVFLASLAAAYSVENLGNSKSITSKSLFKSLTHILK